MLVVYYKHTNLTELDWAGTVLSYMQKIVALQKVNVKCKNKEELNNIQSSISINAAPLTQAYKLLFGDVASLVSR